MARNSRAAWTKRELERAKAVNAAADQGIRLIIETGKVLAATKAEMPHARFSKWLDELTPFSRRTARCYMRIGRDPNIARLAGSNVTNLTKGTHAYLLRLPGDYTLLDEICGLSEAEFDLLLNQMVIRPDMKRGAIRAARVARRQSKAPPLESVGTEYSAILADPPWAFESYGEGGGDRSPERHYPTMDQGQLEALPVEDLAAQDCALFLWTVPHKMPDSLALMAAWGFEYKSTAFVWHKGTFGLGYWTRKNTEICLVGTRGRPKRLRKNIPEAIFASPESHSAKPDEARRRIERLVAGPYLELFARDRRDGWDAWGNDPKLNVSHDSHFSVAGAQ